MRLTSFVLLLIGLLVVGCNQTSTRAVASPSPSPSSSPIAVAGGCGSTQAYRGNLPQWVDAAGGHNNPSGLPYVITNPADAAGFLFGSPLRAGHPDNPTNKILWVVRLPREGAPLEITGHPVGAAAPTISVFQSANSSPGEIYPSIVDAPQAGCWHLDLKWAGHEAGVDLVYLS